MASVTELYDTRVASGELAPDAAQRGVLPALDRVTRELATAAPAPAAPKSRWLSRLIGNGASAPVQAVKGIYLWGGVGRGKSMLMDLAFECIAVAPKRRIHFHEFMLDVHERLRAERTKESGDPVPPVAAQLAAEAKLLCFDEMVINNTADAMILSRLFSHLLDHGVTVITTSNRPPDDLYKHGLNRELFLPFIALIKERLEVISLNGPVDYRLERLAGLPVWHVPNGPAATEALREAFFRLTDYPVEDAANVPALELPVPGGRTLRVPKALKGVAVFSFRKLCGEARGAADYLAIARNFHTVILVGIPILGPENRNEAARFVTLIDALYEHKVKLLAAADAQPDDLYVSGDGAFEFERTASRLMEMQSADYLAAGHGED